MEIIQNQSLLKLNTFRVDAKAKYFTVIKSENDLKEILKTDLFIQNKFLVLGSGSNILFTKDFDGLIIKNEISGIKKINETEDTVEIEVGGGVEWDDFVLYSVENKFYGVENLVMIPGKVGAAPIQNIGAYGTEVKDTISKVKGILISSGEKKEFSNSECCFGYRDSIFKKELKGEIIITSVVFTLSKKKSVNIGYGSLKSEFEKQNISDPDITDVYNVIKKVRTEKLPGVEEIGSAGSFFKNPVIKREKLLEIQKDFPEIVFYEIDENSVKLPAAWLIDKCGFKGKRAGDTGTYKNQALVIVNYNKATGKEIEEFSVQIKNAVLEKFGVEITPEVNIF
ncbi:MAG: UDP-N-acetylmuramate dehydrogenase [Rhodothermaceae bacterium]